MWNPFKKETLWESLGHKLHREHSNKKRVLIMTLWWGILLLGGIVFVMNPEAPQEKPPIDEVVIQVSWEVQPEPEVVDPKKPQAWEICIRRPDVFIFRYQFADKVDDMRAIELQLGTIHQLAKQWSIALIDEKKLQTSLDRDCFPGNPLWVISLPMIDDSFMKFSEKYSIPFYTEKTGSGVGIDWKTFTGLTTQEHILTESTTPETIKEILRKYLEIESGWLFKNLP